MPAPGPQNPTPNFADAERRKSYTSSFSWMDWSRSEPPSALAWIRWSQWTVVGTAVLARRVCMNASIAVWPSTSCRATRSGCSSTRLFPGSISCVSGSVRWESRTFSARVRGRPSLLRTTSKRRPIAPYTSETRSGVDSMVTNTLTLLDRSRSGARGRGLRTHSRVWAPSLGAQVRLCAASVACRRVERARDGQRDCPKYS